MWSQRRLPIGFAAEYLARVPSQMPLNSAAVPVPALTADQAVGDIRNA